MTEFLGSGRGYVPKTDTKLNVSYRDASGEDYRPRSRGIE
jgi:hypothetical protein